jgi:hypothetical protein
MEEGRKKKKEKEQKKKKKVYISGFKLDSLSIGQALRKRICIV